MTCGFPGCKLPPDGEPVLVKATRTDDLRHLEKPRTEALTDLCATHRDEFELLGWLAPAEEEEES